MWSPPVYNSKDIPAESTVSYNVILTNKTGDIIVDTTITDTFIEVDNITDCDTFNVSVTALKGQYVSINNTDGNNGSEYHGYMIAIIKLVNFCNSWLTLLPALINNILVNVGLSNPVPIEKNTQNFLKPNVTFYVSNCLQVY